MGYTAQLDSARWVALIKTRHHRLAERRGLAGEVKRQSQASVSEVLMSFTVTLGLWIRTRMLNRPKVPTDTTSTLATYVKGLDWHSHPTAQQQDFGALHLSAAAPTLQPESILEQFASNASVLFDEDGWKTLDGNLEYEQQSGVADTTVHHDRCRGSRTRAARTKDAPSPSDQVVPVATLAQIGVPHHHLLRA